MGLPVFNFSIFVKNKGSFSFLVNGRKTQCHAASQATLVLALDAGDVVQVFTIAADPLFSNVFF